MQNTGYSFITPSSTCLSEDLLFFDTFSHSGSEKDNFDLVQFPSPVVIDLIKIVPLGQPIEAKIPGNVRLGATNPSNCELEFFINDLTKQDAHTMTDLGRFYCSEKETDFNPPLQIQTDGLLLRGSYRTLTLAIFGQIATYDEKTEDDQVLLSAASPPAQTPASPVASERDIPYIVRSVDQELIRRARDESESFDESTLKSGELMKDELFDNVDMIDIDESAVIKERDRLALEEMSSNEGGQEVSFTSHDKRNDEIEHSNGTDIENFTKRSIKDEQRRHKSRSTDNENGAGDQSEDGIDEDVGEWSFNAFTYRPKPLMYFPDPSQTLQERNIVSELGHNRLKDPVEKEVEKVKEMFDAINCSDDLKSEDWVTLVEDLTNDIANLSLTHTVRNNQMLEFLVKQISHGLDINLALKQKQTGFKVRHLRAGMKLATILFHCGSTAVVALLEASIPQKVLQLYGMDQMSLPIRLLIFKCLNAACDTVEGVEHLIRHKYDWTGTSLDVESIKRRILEQDQYKESLNERDETKARFDSPAGNDVNQYQFDNKDVHSMQTRKQSPDKIIPPDEESNNLLTCYQFMTLILLSQPKIRVTIAIGSLFKKIRLYQNFAQLFAMSSEGDGDTEDSVFNSESVPRGNHLELTSQILQDIINLTKDKGVDIAQPVRYFPAKIQFQVKPNSSDTYLAIYKWLKHFQILKYLNILLNVSQSDAADSVTNSEIEHSIRLRSLCLIFIQQILDSPRGTQFFLSNDLHEIAGSLIKTLGEKQCSKRSSHLRMSDGIENCLSASREETFSAASYHDMSLRLSYNFKIFSCIDKLFYFHREMTSKRGESSSHDPEKVLHQLYIMSEHPYGLAAIVRHFSCIGNLDCLLKFLNMPDYHKQLEFVKETSIDYALELIGTFFRLNNNVLEIADEYLDSIIELSKTKDKTLSARIKSLLPWLSPFEADQTLPLITYSEDTFKHLGRIIRSTIPDSSIPFAKGLDFELPPQLITAVRILRQLCISPQVESFIEATFNPFSLQKLSAHNSKSPSSMAFVDSLPHQQNHNQSWNLNLQLSRNNGINNLFDDSITDQLAQISNTFKLFQPYEESICGELKYHYGILYMSEHVSKKRLLNTLRELIGNYPRPIYQSAALSGLRGRIVISYLNSVIVLLHSLQCHIIDVCGSELRDDTIIPVMLDTYSLLCFVPKPDIPQGSDSTINSDMISLQKSISIRNDNYQLAQQTKKLILSILMSFTQMCFSISESDEKVISETLWTKMLKSVVDFTMSTPVFFHHGLEMLTRILPAPLPCSSMMDSIDQEQLFKNINHRKLWSAHLHPLHQQIEQMISQLSICYQSNIRTLLCYLCNQLCDLSSSAACMVAKIVTETLISCATKLTLDTNGNISPEHNQNSQLQTSLNEDRLNTHVLSGTKESAYAVKMILNLLSNLITNQAFETAFTNHLQVIGKKDEKLLANLQNTLKLHEDYKPGDLVEENINSGNSVHLTSVTHLIDSIKAINDSSTKDGYPVIDVAPPEELTKINLLDVARKTSDRISLTSSLKQTYRLKVLLDILAYNNPTNESSASKRFDHAPYNYQEISVPSSHKSYVAPLRGRGRSSARPDSFRSRPQNTSRPPSIHVDDFIDLYGDNSSQPSSSSRYLGSASSGSKSSDYRRRVRSNRP